MIDAVLAIDIGTQSSRAALLDGGGQILALAARPHHLAVPRPGWAEQNPEAWWQATIQNMRDVLGRVSTRARVAAVAVCGQMHGAVPVARDGMLLADAVQIWCDKRAAPIVAEVSEHQDLDALQRRSGNIPNAAWSGFKMAWMRREQPTLYSDAWRILTPKDFINFRLTGVVATDRTEASGSFLMDIVSNEWSPELIALLGLDAGKLPGIWPSSAVIGSVSAGAARLTGLVSGTPVVAGSGDMLCQLLGSGISVPGTACDTSGTASIISFYAEQPILDRRLMNLHAAGPHWITFGILDSGGGSLRWWHDGFFGARETNADATYDQMMEEASRAPAGCEGLLFLPYLLGERTLGTANSRGVFFGLHSRHDRAHATRAILEGICLDLRQSLEIARDANVSVTEMRTGGGGARSALWSQIKADVYGTPVVTIQHEETGILGAAMLAMVGAGMYGSEAEAACLARERERFAPDQRAVALYNRKYALFRDLHERLQPNFCRAAELEDQ
ncbi:MAG: hypothetical protein IT338_18575 [Thermomicrobiales bacterium]|nr:hypothetical protein [Thermomicrobiales bacterium]